MKTLIKKLLVTAMVSVMLISAAGSSVSTVTSGATSGTGGIWDLFNNDTAEPQISLLSGTNADTYDEDMTPYENPVPSFLASGNADPSLTSGLYLPAVPQLPPVPVSGASVVIGDLPYTDDYNNEASLPSGSGEGFASYYWPDGDSYTGYWHNGLMHGQGTYIWSNGDRYTGDWYEGKITGYGTFTYAEGDKYTGEWEDGHKTGQGVMVLADGSSFIGIWRDDYSPGGLKDGLFTLISNEGGTPGELTKKEIIRWQDSMVLIKCYDRYSRLISTGSGFVISSDGIIATNYHVIQKAYSAEAVGADETTTYKISGIISYDAGRDLALIQSSGAENVKPVIIGDSSKSDIGDDVIAIGSPYGLQNTVSDGIISGLRNFDGYSFIQTTAALSSGSSGGALFNMSGEVIGITSSKIASGENLNFAIPSNDLAEMLRKAREK
ncbi:MAG: trypsin-like peptidase domain-containing protein [Eubacteriales bacterium]|nr:trypsin-like peptidase domain-containing protein [Eubacteriales bacterium]